MAISYANIQVTKVLTLRGNTIQNNRYTGLPGELTVDTQAKTIRIHDGVTPGGNVIQGASGASSYANANVKVYLSQFDGNIIPSANVTYTLGNITHQWRDLFVSNNTIYVGGVPLSIDATGNLTVNGNTIPTVAYVNTAVANVTVDLSSYALNANVTAANVGLKGYVDQANTIQSAQISSANVGMKGYVDQQITDLIGGAPSILDTLNEIAASINDDANVYTSLTNSIATANTALKGYVDQANTIQNNQVTQANVGMKGYVDNQSFYSNAKVAAYLPTYSGNITANYFIGYTQGLVGSITNLDSLNFSVENISALVAGNGVNIGAGGNNNLLVLPAEVMIQNVPLSVTSNIIFSDASKQTTAWTGTVDYANVTNAYSNVQVGVYTNLSTYAYSANVTAANVGLKGYVDFANTIMKAYVDGQITAANANVGIGSYSNVQVATYLPTYTGTLAGGALNLSGQDGTTVVDFQTGAATNQIITLSSDYTFSIKAGDGAGNRGHLVLESGRNSRVKINGNGSNVLITAGNGTQSSTWTFANSGVLTFPDGTTQSTAGGAGSNYGNVNVKAYTESMGFQNYGNSNVTAYLNATGYNLYSNVNVAAYLSTATINTTGNITAQNLTGNISITGNVTGTSANVTLQAGSFSSTFDNQGNVRLPTAYVTGNVTANYFIGNGALLTGIAASSNYSNVNVATYLPTYSGNIANIRLGVSGVLTFADGTTQITAGGGSYSNVQVAAYLTTGVNTAAPQIQLTNATSNYIKYNNVGVGAPTFTTANVGTRIIYWSSVDANTADYAVGIDAGTLWHGIPRATSGFAFKWYGGTTQIAMLEGTGSFTIANIRLSPSGNIVFADGTVQTTAATGTYSNIQVATYLPTYTGSLNASNILVTSANITIANIQATTAATNTATGALRVMGGAGIAGTVFAGQLNTTGNLIANAVSAYSLNTVANVVASVVNAGTINSAGNILAQNIIGTIATASQTGITAVGTLATLSVTGNATVGNLVGTEANTRIIANVYTTTFDIYGNVSFPGNVNVSGLGVTMPTRPAFRVNGTAAPITTANVNLKGSAITTIFNQGNYLDTTTGKFTAPIAGIYEVLLNARVGSYNGLSQIAVLKNGNNSQGNVVCFWEIGSTTGTANHFGVSGTINLVAGDYLSANILAGNISFDSNDNWCVTYLG